MFSPTPPAVEGSSKGGGRVTEMHYIYTPETKWISGSATSPLSISLAISLAPDLIPVKGWSGYYIGVQIFKIRFRFLIIRFPDTILPDNPTTMI